MERCNAPLLCSDRKHQKQRTHQINCRKPCNNDLKRRKTVLFTSTSALCVTGLVVQDTGSYWSAFGQSVILLLIQIGGLGVITVGAAFALLSGRKISLKQRSTMQEATAAPQMGGIVRLTGFILRITALFELVGAAPVSYTHLDVYKRQGHNSP